MNPLKEFFADEMVLSAMSKGNHFTKQEVLKWLSSHLPEARSVPREDMMAMVPTLYAAVEANNAALACTPHAHHTPQRSRKHEPRKGRRCARTSWRRAHMPTC